MKRLMIVLLALSAFVGACNLGKKTPLTQAVGEPPIKATPTIEATAEATAEPSPQTILPVDEIDAPIVESPNIAYIDMLNQKDGWGANGAKIFRTNDGGVTWYDTTPLKGETQNVYNVHPDFLDEKNAWALYADADVYPNGGTLYRTTDGGETWDSFSVPFSEGDLEFIDAKNGWMMASLGVGAGSMGVSIFQTQDGGETWTRAYTNDHTFDDAGDSLPLGGLKNFIYPLDMETAWVGGVIYMAGRVYLYRTDDGGATWAEQPVILSSEAAGGELSALDLTFFSPTTGLLTLRSLGDVLRTEIYLTQDGGKTWASSDIVLEGYGSLTILSENEMLFFAEGKLDVTQDAGKTWNVVQPDIDFTDVMVSMDFISPQIGWVITSDVPGEYSLYRTEDGGATWFAIAQ